MTGRPLYRTLAAIGFLSHLLALLVLLANTTSSRGFFVTVALVDVVGAVAVTRFPWGRWAGLACALVVSITTFWLLFSAFAVTSVFDFFAGLAGFFGYLTVLVASILGLGKSRGEKLAGPGHQRAVAAVAAAVLALTALSAVLTVTGQKTVSPSEASGAVEVLMKNDEFVPSTIQVTQVETKFLLHNSDRVAHTFTVERYDVDEIVTPGSDALVTLRSRPDALGRVEFVCEFHPGMKGTLEIT